MKEIPESNYLQDYKIKLEDDVAPFTRNTPAKENEFVRDNPIITKGKSEQEVKRLIFNPKKTRNSKKSADRSSKINEETGNSELKFDYINLEFKKDIESVDCSCILNTCV